MLLHYIKVATRHLLKSKTQGIISILGLTAGLFCFIICNFYNHESMRGDGYFPTYQKMVDIRLRYDGMGEDDYIMWMADADKIFSRVDSIFSNEIEATAKYSYSEPTLIKIEGRKRDLNINTINTNGSFFKVFPNDVIEGSLKAYEKDDHAAVVTKKMAKRIFGKESPLGKTFQLKGTIYREPLAMVETYRIVAVIEDYPIFLKSGFDWYNNDIFLRNNNELKTVLLFKSVDNLKQDNKKLTAYDFQSEGKKVLVKLFNKSEEINLNITTLVVAVIGLLVLCIGFTNFASFCLGNFWTRSSELALRKTLGSSKTGLFIMLVIELILLMIPALLLTLVLIEFVPSLYGMLPNEAINNLPPFNTTALIQHALICMLAIFIIISVLAYISLYAKHSNKSRHSVRNTLLGFQFFIALFFMLALTGTYQQRRAYDIAENMNISSDDLKRTVTWEAGIHRKLRVHKEEIIQKISQLSSVEYIGKSGNDIDKINELDKYVSIFKLDSIWLKLAGMESIIKKTRSNTPQIIISKEVEKMMASKEYNSLTLNNDSVPRTIAEVVDYKLNNSSLPSVIISGDYERDYDSYLIRLHSTDDVAAFIRKLDGWQNEYLAEGEQNSINTMDKQYKSIGAELLLWIFILCSIITLLISVSGLYGAITIDTIHRQKEMAIRKVNGAKTKDIWWMFGRLYIRLYIIASVLACTAGYAVCISLSKSSNYSNELFNYNNPIPWIVVLIAAALIIILTVAWKINRISKLNPATIIKSE